MSAPEHNFSSPTSATSAVTPDSELQNLDYSLPSVAANITNNPGFDAQKLLNSIGDACYVLDDEWKFVFVNDSAERLVQRKREELLGKSVWDEFPEAVGSGFDRHYRRAVAENIVTSVEEYYPPLDTWFSVRVFPYQGGVAVFFQDVDERKRAERKAQERTVAILESITDAFFSLDSNYCFTYINDQSERLMNRSREELLGRCFWEEFPPIVGSIFEVNYRRAFEQQLTVTFEAYYAPLQIWCDVRAYPSDEGLSVFYQDVTERKKAQEVLERSRLDLQLAVDGAHLGTFYCNWPLDKIIWNQTCKEHFFLPPDADVDIGLFYSLLHPDDREPTRQAIEKAQKEHVEYDVEYRALAPDGRSRWINAIGRFYYADDGTPTRFDGITIDISVQRARSEREALLNRIGQTLRASNDAEQVLKTAMREIGLALNTDRCYYATYDLDSDSATIVTDWSRNGLHSIAGQYRMSDFVVNHDQKYRSGHTQVVNNNEDDLALLACGMRAFVRVPLAFGRTMSALSVAMSSPRIWTDTEVELLESVATLTQTALQSVRVREREHRIAQQLQDALQPDLPTHIHQLSLGHRSQAALDEAQVGGDFYDVFALDQRHYAIVIGDVSGKGLAAAQQLALVRNTLRAMLYRLKSPAEAAAAINEIVSSHSLLVGFVTCWVGLYDTLTGEVRYSCCGHEPPLIRRINGSVEELEMAGLPLGIDVYSDYTEGAFKLASGDILLLYTDGITEAGIDRRNPLGTNGLVSLLAALPQGASIQTLANQLVDDVLDYAGVFRDDVAVLLCRKE